MKFIQFTRAARLLGAACLLAAGSGQALAGINGPLLSDCTSLAGTNGLVTVTECAFSGGSGPISYGGAYGISVSGDTGARPVTAFHVSTNNLPSPNDDSNHLLPFTTRSGWKAEYYSAQAWKKAFPSAFGQSYGELFGSDQGVYVYRAATWGGVNGRWTLLNPLDPSSSISASSLTFGWYGGSPDSHFVALDVNDKIVSQSFTSPVPEPSAYALMLAGLGALGVMVRRRRTG